MKKFWHYGVPVFIVLLVADQLTKYHIVTNYALHESRNVLPFVWFTYVQNTGANWGTFQGFNAAFIWLSIIAFGLLVAFYDSFKTTPEKISYTLILVGLWGNLLDRGIHGFVIDFVDLRWWPVFNIADSCICIAIVIYMIAQLWQPRTRSYHRASRGNRSF